jgi:hypothetical protein
MEGLPVFRDGPYGGAAATGTQQPHDSFNGLRHALMQLRAPECLAAQPGSIFPRAVQVGFKAYRGGKSRRKTPRPWQRVEGESIEAAN